MFLMVRRHSSAVSNHEAEIAIPGLSFETLGFRQAPQDEEIAPAMTQ
jgi:hypothetical protein